MSLPLLDAWFHPFRRTESSHGFRGGLALDRDKPGLGIPIVDVPVPDQLVYPLLGYAAHDVAPAVEIGQHVKRGARLADGILASAAGTITALETRPIAHPSGQRASCLILTTDKDDTADVRGSCGNRGRHDASDHDRNSSCNDRADAGDPEGRHGIANACGKSPLPALPALTLERLEEAGVGGLGGAGFMLHVKLRSITQPVHTLIVNAAECEPGLSCDEALMLSEADRIVQGCQALATLIDCRRTILVIEADKQDALVAMTTAIEVTGASIEIRTVAPVYPSGAEPLTVQLATGRRLGAGERPSAHGMLCINVATALTAGQARLGEPQTTRIVTIGGALARAPCNARVAFGTPVSHVLMATGQFDVVNRDVTTARLRIGGPLSGYDIADAATPVTTTVNRIALEPPLDVRRSYPCIRCAACSDVCPVALLPQELLRHARADDTPALERHGLDACLECGCCDVVCPSAIPLTATFRHARGERRDARRRRSEADAAETRFRRREERLSRPMEAMNDPVADALARVRGKRRSNRKPLDGQRHTDPDEGTSSP